MALKQGAAVLAVVSPDPGGGTDFTHGLSNYVPIAPVPDGFLDARCSGSHGNGDCMRRYHTIAYTKLSVSRCLVQHGIDVVIMDVDALVTGNLTQLVSAQGADVLTIMDDQSPWTRRSPPEHSYSGPFTWGLPFRARRAIGGPGARTGHCLAVAYFRSCESAERLLSGAQQTFVRVFAQWWLGANESGSFQWAEKPRRTLLQQSFAWALAETIGEAGYDELRVAFTEARSACEPTTAYVRLVGGSAESLRVGYLPHNASFEPGAGRWCRNVACANSTWVKHCFGTSDEKLECARNAHNMLA